MIEIWCLLYLASFLTFTSAQLPPVEATCDPEFFGRPENQDCKDALARLPDWGMTHSHDEGWEPVRAFVRIGDQVGISDPDNQEGNVRTPLMLTNGTCSVVVVIPDEGYFEETTRMLVETRKLNAKAEFLRSKCVEHQGSGGLYHGVRQCKFGSVKHFPKDLAKRCKAGRGYDIEEFPNVYIYGPNTDAERYLDYLYNCFTDTDGNELCKNTEQAEDIETDWIKFIQEIQVPESGGSAPKGSNRACRGSCLDLEDCDIGSDCLCASTKGMLLSSTWGKHSCMHVAGTAIAIAAAAIRPSKTCRGRCLLEEDGTVEISLTANHTNATASLDVPLANLTNLLNASSPTSFSLPTLPSHASPTLICPCNCTYVSASCCLSRLVWEEPAAQIHTSPPPENATVTCDIGSGKWMPKPTTLRTPMEDNGGFIGLGSVKWNSSASVNSKIP